MNIEKLTCCLAKPMNAIRDLTAKVNEIIQGHNELSNQVKNLPSGGGNYTPPTETPEPPETPSPGGDSEYVERFINIHGFADVSTMAPIDGGYSLNVIPDLEGVEIEPILENIHELDIIFTVHMDEETTFFRLPFLYFDGTKMQFGATIAGQSSFLLTAYESEITMEMKNA